MATTGANLADITDFIEIWYFEIGKTGPTSDYLWLCPAVSHRYDGGGDSFQRLRRFLWYDVFDDVKDSVLVSEEPAWVCVPVPKDDLDDFDRRGNWICLAHFQFQSARGVSGGTYSYVRMSAIIVDASVLAREDVSVMSFSQSALREKLHRSRQVCVSITRDQLKPPEHAEDDWGVEMRALPGMLVARDNTSARVVKGLTRKPAVEAVRHAIWKVPKSQWGEISFVINASPKEYLLSAVIFPPTVLLHPSAERLVQMGPTRMPDSTGRPGSGPAPSVDRNPQALPIPTQRGDEGQKLTDQPQALARENEELRSRILELEEKQKYSDGQAKQKVDIEQILNSFFDRIERRFGGPSATLGNTDRMASEDGSEDPQNAVYDVPPMGMPRQQSEEDVVSQSNSNGTPSPYNHERDWRRWIPPIRAFGRKGTAVGPPSDRSQADVAAALAEISRLRQDLDSQKSGYRRPGAPGLPVQPVGWLLEVLRTHPWRSAVICGVVAVAAVCLTFQHPEPRKMLSQFPLARNLWPELGSTGQSKLGPKEQRNLKLLQKHSPTIYRREELLKLYGDRPLTPRNIDSDRISLLLVMDQTEFGRPTKDRRMYASDTNLLKLADTDPLWRAALGHRGDTICTEAELKAFRARAVFDPIVRSYLTEATRRLATADPALEGVKFPTWRTYQGAYLDLARAVKELALVVPSREPGMSVRERGEQLTVLGLEAYLDHTLDTLDKHEEWQKEKVRENRLSELRQDAELIIERARQSGLGETKEQRLVETYLPPS